MITSGRRQANLPRLALRSRLMSAIPNEDPAGQAAGLHPGTRSGGRPGSWLEPWSAPFALVNGSAVGLAPILLPLVAARDGVGHVGLVMGAFNLGAFAAPLAGSLADRFHAYRAIAAACAAVSALTLWLFPLLGQGMQIVLALGNGAGFAGAVTVANLLIVERRPSTEWNQRLGWLETALSVGQGAALFLAAWLSGLSARTGLLIGALVPAAAVPLAILLIPRMPSAPGQRAERSGHRLASAGQVGEWGPASPSRAHHLHQRRRLLAGIPALLSGGFGWLLAAWIPAYAGSAIVFALYPVLFQHAFGIAPQTSALAFAVIVFVSLPLFLLAGRVSQRRGPAVAMAGAFAVRVVLLAVLAVLAAIGHVGSVLPLAAFAGIFLAWSFLSVASPGLTGQLRPDAEGDAQGLLNASSGLAGLIGSVAGGAAASAWGFPAALIMGAAGVAIGLVVFAATLLRHRGA
jgi:MFS transporter, DHA1 family, tetracycline resistance protein